MEGNDENILNFELENTLKDLTKRYTCKMEVLNNDEKFVIFVEDLKIISKRNSKENFLNECEKLKQYKKNFFIFIDNRYELKV